MLKSRSITTQFTFIFVIALLLVVGSFYLVLDSVYRVELKSQAETVADNVDAFGSWVSQYGRVWVKDDNKSFLGQVTLVNAADAGVPPDQWHFYSKNPALAQRPESMTCYGQRFSDQLFILVSEASVRRSSPRCRGRGSGRGPWPRRHS